MKYHLYSDPQYIIIIDLETSGRVGKIIFFLYCTFMILWNLLAICPTAKDNSVTQAPSPLLPIFRLSYCLTKKKKKKSKKQYRSLIFQHRFIWSSKFWLHFSGSFAVKVSIQPLWSFKIFSPRKKNKRRTRTKQTPKVFLGAVPPRCPWQCAGVFQNWLSAKGPVVLTGAQPRQEDLSVYNPAHLQTLRASCFLKPELAQPHC